MVTEITQLSTHWDAAEAHVVIEFLDELRDLLWATYGDKIIDMHVAEHELKNDRQIDLKFDV